MRFSSRDQILGVFLGPIAAHGAHVTKLEDHRGHFRINQTVNCLVKYSRPVSPPSGPGTSTWGFHFSRNEQRILSDDLGHASLFGRALVGLICVPDSICLLKSDEWRKLLRPVREDSRENVRVTRPTGCWMEVEVPNGPELDHKIPQSRFPDLLFERGLPGYRHQ